MVRCVVGCLQIGPRAVFVSVLLEHEQRASDSARTLVKEIVSRRSTSLPRDCRKANRKQAESRARGFPHRGPEHEVKVGVQSLSPR